VYPSVVPNAAIQAGFAAYHRYFKTTAGMMVSYSVIPDHHANPGLLTHEIAESISDPTSPPGWGEICDPCENLPDAYVLFHNNWVATFWSPLQKQCVGPKDDGHGVLGMDIEIHMRSPRRPCTGLIVEGSKLTFTVSASKNGVPVVVTKAEWSYHYPGGGSHTYVGPVLSVTADRDEGIDVWVYITDESGCRAGSTGMIHINTISQSKADLLDNICRLQTEFLKYDQFWSLHPEPWKASREFLNNPITLNELGVMREFAERLLSLTDALASVPNILREPLRLRPPKRVNRLGRESERVLDNGH
jgi:hypothetical protein